MTSHLLFNPIGLCILQPTGNNQRAGGGRTSLRHQNCLSDFNVLGSSAELMKHGDFWYTGSTDDRLQVVLCTFFAGDFHDGIACQLRCARNNRSQSIDWLIDQAAKSYRHLNALGVRLNVSGESVMTDYLSFLSFTAAQKINAWTAVYMCSYTCKSFYTSTKCPWLKVATKEMKKLIVFSRDCPILSRMWYLAVQQQQQQKSIT